jgi:hypothetical protein
MWHMLQGRQHIKVAEGIAVARIQEIWTVSAAKQINLSGTPTVFTVLQED